MKVSSKPASDAPPEPIETAPGLTFPRDGVRVVATETPYGHEVEALVVIRDGRLVAREVTVRQVGDDDPPVTGEVLRQVQVAELVQYAVARIGRIAGVLNGYEFRVDSAMGEAEDYQRARERGMTDGTLLLVAQTYRLGLLMARAPTKLVEEWFNIPRSTAGRWIAAARARGYLEPAEGKGKAGG